MRIHTNGLGGTLPSPRNGFGTTHGLIEDALNEQKALGRIAPSVAFKVLRPHRSSIRQIAYEVQLEAAAPGQGRRAGNSGSYGAMRPEVDGYAATYDEWGWLLAALYRLDPNMVVGTPSTPTYRNVAHFDRETALTYNPEVWLAHVMEWPPFADDRDPYPIVTGKAAKTKAGYIIGRRGADRTDHSGTRPYWSHKEQPRTVAEVLAFAWPNGAPEQITERYGKYLTPTTDKQEVSQ